MIHKGKKKTKMPYQVMGTYFWNVVAFGPSLDDFPPARGQVVLHNLFFLFLKICLLVSLCILYDCDDDDMIGRQLFFICSFLCVCGMFSLLFSLLCLSNNLTAYAHMLEILKPFII